MSRFLFIREQIFILMLLKYAVCNETACWYKNEKICKEDKVVIKKRCDLKSRGGHGVRWRNFHRRVGPEPALIDLSKKWCSWYDWQASW